MRLVYIRLISTFASRSVPFGLSSSVFPAKAFRCCGSNSNKFADNALSDDNTKVTAYSMAEAAKSPFNIEELHLDATQDLRCVNIFCSKVGGACVCRLARFLEQTRDRLSSIEHMSLRSGGLDRLPDELWNMTMLKTLDLQDNALCEIPPGIVRLEKLNKLKIGGNPLLNSIEHIGSFVYTLSDQHNNSKGCKKLRNIVVSRHMNSELLDLLKKQTEMFLPDVTITVE